MAQFVGKHAPALRVALFVLARRAGEDLTSAQQLAVKLGLRFSPTRFTAASN
jgi:hypothetical protein